MKETPRVQTMTEIEGGDAFRCTDRAAAIIDGATERRRQPGVIDVLVSLMVVEEGVGQHVLNERGVRRDDIFSLGDTCGEGRIASLSSIQQIAEQESRTLGHQFIGSEHLLLACLRLVEGRPEEGAIHKATLTNYSQAKAEVLELLGEEFH